jgi:hypothetical protein
MKAQVTLTIPESKRLIGKAVREHPLVKKALREGIVAIGSGSTNAYVAEELIENNLQKERYVAGFIYEEGTCIVPQDERIKNVVLEKGEIMDEPLNEVVKKMNVSDVFIKGANAIDYDGVAGVMMASLTGGTIGEVLGILKAKGVKLIIPVGLEKLVPHSILDASNVAGIYEMDYSDGVPVGIMPISGEILTELEAFKILSGVDAICIGSGGIGQGEGSKTFILEGSEKEVSKAISTLESIRGEKKLIPIPGDCSICVFKHCPRNKNDK